LHHINTPAGQITPAEFQRAIVGMKTGVVFAGESTAGRAAALVNDIHRFGKPRSLGSLAAAIDSVTLDEVNAYLATRSITRPPIQTLGPTPLKSPI
jgi:predicted Zn-dependent peptidase